MRPIKFRGKTFDDKLVYGDLIHVDENIFIDITPVKPESVAQLVGYDDDGNEVYEGDLLEGLTGTVSAVLDVEICGDRYSIGEKFFGYNLKE